MRSERQRGQYGRRTFGAEKWWGGWGTAVHVGWNWEGDGLHMDIVFLLDIFEQFMPRLEADAIIANIQVNDNKTLFK